MRVTRLAAMADNVRPKSQRRRANTGHSTKAATRP